MQIADIDLLLSRLDGSGSNVAWNAVRELRSLPNLPYHLLRWYKNSKGFGARSACVYHAARYASSSMEARELGVLALQDKSKVVRYRAALLLAVAQDRSAIPQLEAMAARHTSNSSAADASAAIRAIMNGDPNMFVDRDGSGMITLRIEQSDA